MILKTQINDLKNLARIDFLAGMNVEEIAQKHNRSARTIRTWSANENWRKPISIEETYQLRLEYLVNKKKKSREEIFEIEKLNQCLIQLKKSQEKKEDRKQNSEGDHSGHSEKFGFFGIGKGKRIKNDVSFISPEDPKWTEDLYPFQLEPFESENRFEFYVKSRQIGGTKIFSRKGFHWAIKKQHNQLFFSASKLQSALFRDYIKQDALEKWGVELEGTDVIRLHIGNDKYVNLHFLATNLKTAQSYHGDLWGDEVFWIGNFSKFHQAASGMAAQVRYCKTYFSTPSHIAHPAYAMWAQGGNQYKTIVPKRINIHDAISGGFDLLNIEQLRGEYSESDFAQLFECRFIDPSDAVFNFDDLVACQSDQTKWLKHNPFLPVWVGVDVSRTRDNSCIVVLLPPQRAGGKFYILEVIQINNKSFSYQADVIKGLCDRYNVDNLAIDITGIGYGICEQVKTFYPRLKEIHYNIEVKRNLVIKAQSVIQKHRLQYDPIHSSIPASFMTIKRYIAGDLVTYKADRTTVTGHADVAFAAMHALSFESLLEDQESRSSICFFETNLAPRYVLKEGIYDPS